MKSFSSVRQHTRRLKNGRTITVHKHQRGFTPVINNFSNRTITKANVKNSVNENAVYDSLTSTPNDKRYGLFIDNPQGSWLEREKLHAKDRYLEGHKWSGSVTAGSFRLPMETDSLLDVKGGSGEETRINTPVSRERIEQIKKSIKKEGFKGSINIWVNYKGESSIAEGNHRLRAVKELGLKTIPVQLTYMAGGETAQGRFNLKELIKNK